VGEVAWLLNGFEWTCDKGTDTTCRSDRGTAHGHGVDDPRRLLVIVSLLLMFCDLCTNRLKLMLMDSPVFAQSHPTGTTAPATAPLKKTNSHNGLIH
jgi:hypothetical protein